jgi:uncharacterized protein
VSKLEILLTTITDHGLSLDVVVPANSITPSEIAPLPLEDVRVQGTLKPMVGQYLFQGSISATFVHSCDRCLQEATFPAELEVTWTFEEGPEKDYIQQLVDEAESEADEEVEAHGVFTFQGTSIDLTGPVWDEVSLAAPTKFVCRESCEGLCPVCGVDRNTSPCSCLENTEETPTSNSGFAGLKDMFPDLPES